MISIGIVTEWSKALFSVFHCCVVCHIAVTARALTMGVTNDCKSMSVKLRYWIVNIIQRDTARPLVSRLCILKGSFT